MNQGFIDSQWSTLCRSASGTAGRLSEEVSPQSAELMQSEARRFTERAAPADKPLLEAMYSRRMAHSARLPAIARADALTRNHPGAVDEVFARLEEFCHGDFPATSEAFLEMQVRNVELTKAVAGICEAHVAPSG